LQAKAHQSAVNVANYGRKTSIDENTQGFKRMLLFVFQDDFINISLYNI